MIDVKVCLLASVVLFGAVSCQKDDVGKCKQDMLDWCSANDYPTEEQGSFSSSMTNYDSDLGTRVSCVSTSRGTECRKKSSPWFTCSPDKTVTYKDQPLTTESEVDDEICSARDQAVQFRIQGNTFTSGNFNDTQFKAGMEQMQANLAKMRRQMSRIFGDGFPFKNYNKYDDDDYYGK